VLIETFQVLACERVPALLNKRKIAGRETWKVLLNQALWPHPQPFPFDRRKSVRSEASPYGRKGGGESFREEGVLATNKIITTNQNIYLT